MQQTDLLGMLRNNSKDSHRALVVVFGIEINISYFIAHLYHEKLEKLARTTTKILRQKSISFVNIQSLVRFLFFYLQVVRFSRVFMKKLSDFINYFSQVGLRIILKKYQSRLEKTWNSGINYSQTITAYYFLI